MREPEPTLAEEKEAKLGPPTSAFTTLANTSLNWVSGIQSTPCNFTSFPTHSQFGGSDTQGGLGIAFSPFLAPTQTQPLINKMTPVHDNNQTEAPSKDYKFSELGIQSSPVILPTQTQSLKVTQTQGTQGRALLNHPFLLPTQTQHQVLLTSGKTTTSLH